MKKIILGILFIFNILVVNSAMAQWVQQADFGGGKIYDAASFVIGNYAYVATGSNYIGFPVDRGYQRFMYRYDPSLDVWKRMADLPPAGKATVQAVGFAIGEKGYVCGGVENATLWEYDPATNLWSQRINCPRAIKEGIGFAITLKAYVGLGGANEIDYKNDFYEYDPSKNKWTQLNDFPGAPRRGSIGFSMNGKGYTGLGYKDIGSNNHGYFKDLWEYDPLTDDWTRLPDFPGEAREDAIGFGIDGAIYVGMGGINDFYKYDLKTKEWSTLNYIPGNYRISAFSFCIGSGIYYGGGMSPNLTSDMWKYSTGSVTSIAKKLEITALKYSPNPVIDDFQISGVEGVSTLLFTDLNGKVLLTKQVTGNETISVNSLPKGIYIVKIISSEGLIEGKLVKK